MTLAYAYGQQKLATLLPNGGGKPYSNASYVRHKITNTRGAALYLAVTMRPKCPILPICDSNCANDRLMNLYHGADKELCCAYKENDYSLLKERLLGVYQQIQEQAKHTPP